MTIQLTTHSAFFNNLLGMRELLGVCVELVKASTGTKSISASAVNLGVAATRFDFHPAYRIFRRPAEAWSSPVMSFMTMVAMNHVGPAAEPHHEIKERRKQKE
jgi:hypothetical protein